MSALGCGVLKTYDAVVLLRSVYVCLKPKSGGDLADDCGFSRRPSWRKLS